MRGSLVVGTGWFSASLLFCGTAVASNAFGVDSECDAVPDNVAINCGFEADADPHYGDPPEWTASGFFFSYDYGVGRYHHSGNFGMWMYGDNVTAGCIQQTLTTVPGQSYDLSCWSSCDFTANGEVLWNDARIALTSCSEFPPYSQVRVAGLIGTGADTLKFCNGSYPYGYLYLDDIVVILSTAGPSSPDPTQ